MGMESNVKWYLIESFRGNYHRSGRDGKGKILSEVMELLNCHRKHAIRLMREKAFQKKPRTSKRGRKSKYDNKEFLQALHRVRKVMEFRNAEVVKENMAEWLPFIEAQYGEFNKEVREKLLIISASTMKRLIRKLREENGKGLCTTRPGSILRTEIPIRTESLWDETTPGYMAADTVAHCGGSVAGEFIFSLDMVCPVTHWTAQRAVWGKGATSVLEQTQNIEKSLPFPMVGLHVDNGSEFLNQHYKRAYLDEHRKFSFTRSRAYKKNDNCHVEQKNWSVVRRYFGYDRLDFQELVSLMNDLYSNELNLYLNHFCRTFKLSQKIAIKSRYRRIYGTPQTPYQRVLNSNSVSDDVKLRLMEQHKTLNPVALKIEIERKLRNIFAIYKKITIARKAATAA